MVFLAILAQSASSVAQEQGIGRAVGRQMDRRNQGDEGGWPFVSRSIGIYKFPKKFLYWGLERGFPFPV